MPRFSCAIPADTTFVVLEAEVGHQPLTSADTATSKTILSMNLPRRYARNYGICMAVMLFPSVDLHRTSNHGSNSRR